MFNLIIYLGMIMTMIVISTAKAEDNTKVFHKKLTDDQKVVAMKSSLPPSDDGKLRERYTFYLISNRGNEEKQVGFMVVENPPPFSASILDFDPPAGDIAIYDIAFINDNTLAVLTKYLNWVGIRLFTVDKQKSSLQLRSTGLLSDTLKFRSTAAKITGSMEKKDLTVSIDLSDGNETQVRFLEKDGVLEVVKEESTTRRTD